MTNTNSFKPGDRVKYKVPKEAKDNGHDFDTIYTVKRVRNGTISFEEQPWGCFDHRLELIESLSVPEPKLNIETMKKESLAKIQALAESEVKKFTDIGLNAEFIMRFSNRSNINITSLDLSA